MPAQLQIVFPDVPPFDQNGNPSHPIGWRIYINGTLSGPDVAVGQQSAIRDIADYGEYRVQVSLYNEIGEGPRSAETSVTWDKPMGLPSQPGAPTVSLLLIAGGAPSSGASSAVAWNQEPDISFTEGVAGTYDLDGDVSNASGAYWYGVDTGTLPDGVTMTGARNNVLSYDGVGSADMQDVVFYIEDDALEADFLSRVSGANVVWFHDFKNAAEVDNFRWHGGIGNDVNDTYKPGQCIHNTSDGITPGCLELIYTVADLHAPGWWRPFAPFSGVSNGRGEDDPGASGSLSLEAWDPTNTGENEAFRRAYYANPDYSNPPQAGFTADQFHGEEFWLQFRIKISADRYLSTVPAGKLSFLATTQQTLNQEIVQQNMLNKDALWYTYFGSSPDTGGSMGVPSGTKQPGGDYYLATGQYWEYVPDEWVTMLYHVIPGHHDVKDTLFEVFAARPGATEYETVFTQLNTIRYSNTTNGHPYAYNAFQPSNYMNNQATSVEWSQRYDQIIFSKAFIPCPQV